MVSMQRSLSSPVRVHSSPPVSPTVTHVTSRPPSPTPERQHVVEAPQPRRFTSRSPSRAAENTASLPPPRRSEDIPRRPSASQQASSMTPPARKPPPVIAQLSAPQAIPAAGAGAGAGAGASSSPVPKIAAESAESILDSNLPIASTDPESPPPHPPKMSSKLAKLTRPLLEDASQYSNPQFVPETDSTSLDELAHLVRLSKYQERKRANTRVRLQRSLISTALAARLTRCGEIAHRNLADCFRGDDRKNFANLYNAIHDVRKSCDELRKYALFEPEMEALHSPGLSSADSVDTISLSGAQAGTRPGGVPITPFLNDISAEARDTFMNFLTTLRNNPEYLATRLCSLSTAELGALTAFHQGMEPIESVLPFHNRQPSRSAANRNSGHGPGAVERLLSFQRHDPLSALIHTCFANSSGPGSSEDKRRTEIWATACAKLLSEKGAAGEPILIAVLNAWSSMRDWSGRSNMEWYLMKILEDGAFLLDRAEDQHGTRFNLSDWTSKDQIAAEEFYDRATDDLFEVIDDEDATGIPEGLIELGNQILRKLEPKFVENTRSWLVYKWLFGVWLHGVVIHPEAYGLMTEYHITEYGRQKILKAVALRASKLVIDMTMTIGSSKNMKPVSTPPKIKAHIENIMNRFRGSRARRPTTRLLPARSITSLRETAEVRPYLVVSPSDLVTLVNSLFPERRPLSGSGSIRSGPASVSGFSAVSQPISVAMTRSNPETASVMSSVLSTSASSANSDTTSREPLLEEQPTGTSSRYSPPLQEQKRLSNYEDDGYRLRLAVHDMVNALGIDAVQGSCHPCAERWAVLFISSDGNSLSTQMTYDPDDELEDENSSSNSESDEELEENKPELDKEYHQLRDSILKLVQDYEIPQDLEADGGKTHTFSNRATNLKKYRNKNKIITAEKTLSRNPYRRFMEDKQTSSHDASSTTSSRRDKGKDAASDSPTERQPTLIAMLTAASSQSRAQSDFVSAHLYWRTLQQLNTLSSESLRRDGFAALLNIFSRGPRDSIRRSAAAVEEYDAWLIWLKQSQERAEGLLDTMMKRLRALRDKMWYVTDVRNSGPYEYCRNIAVALKTMGVPKKWDSYQRARQNMPRGPAAASYLFRTESQIVELLAASEEQGGPNKLSDDQAEKTLRWLQQYSVENFCQGEERIHRFCCEIHSCIAKLIGDSIVDAPVLWSSDLYLRDRRGLEAGNKPAPSRDRDGGHFWDDSASVMSDPERRFPSSSSSNGRSGPIARGLGALTTHNMSQQSLNSAERYSFSRAPTVLSDGMDEPNFFMGPSSPVPTIDTTTTYWSPFQPTLAPSSATSRAHSPTTSVTNLSTAFSAPSNNPHGLQTQSHHSTGRPGTSASSNETVHQQRVSEDKTRFLNELRQTLTSLLLSDLGNLVFARGSETDGWFEGLGQECIERREAIEKKARHSVARERRRPHRHSLKQRVIEKKRSFGDLRNAGGDASPSSDNHSQTTETPSSHGGNDSSAASSVDTMTPRSHTARSKEAVTSSSTPDFPFTKAYQRLLRMFSVHPNPVAKLNALYELEHLIIASLSSGGFRRRLARMARAAEVINPTSGPADEHGSGNNLSRAKPLEETIDNVKERRSQTLVQSSPALLPPMVSGRSGSNAETRSMMAAAANPANTDAIANILQSLFRDPAIRPKTLFRDLQFIAAFVSPSTLDKPERGKSFWDTGLAALLLKSEVCRTMVEVADEVVGVYTRSRMPSGPSAASGDGSDASGPSPSPIPPPMTTYSLADAARMWTITAKEGHPTSQRELALFYLSNPELVERTTLPLSKPREVFKQAVMEKYGGPSAGGSRYHGYHGSGSSGSGRPSTSSAGVTGLGISTGPGGAAGKGSDVRSDPALMCIAIHWMEAAERGGDELARAFLAQTEMMQSL